MRAVLMHETGGPEVLRVEEVPTLEPADGEVLIRVRAASVNPIDWKYRRGLAPKDLPAVLGNDVSGTVAQSRAEGFAEGDDVFGISPGGGYAEFATAPAALIAKKPAGVTHEQAAAIPVAGMTAWQALFDRGGLQRGQTLLVARAAGGVGHFAVQFGKHTGARVIGTGSGRNREFMLEMGADEYVDYTAQDVAEVLSGVDVAFDTVGGETTMMLLATVREGGALVVIAGAPPEVEAAGHGVRAELLIMSPNARQLADIAEIGAAGEVNCGDRRRVPARGCRQGA